MDSTSVAPVAGASPCAKTATGHSKHTAHVANSQPNEPIRFAFNEASPCNPNVFGRDIAHPFSTVEPVQGYSCLKGGTVRRSQAVEPDDL